MANRPLTVSFCSLLSSFPIGATAPFWFHHSSFVIRAGALLSALIMFSPGPARCAPRPMAANPADHIIRANREGLAIDPLTEKPYERPQQLAAHINQVLGQAELFGQSRSGTNPTTVRLLVHVHGGLNSFEDTRKRMELV